MKKGTIQTKRHLYGMVYFDEAWQKNISLLYPGELVNIPVVQGETVEKNQLLAEVAMDPAATASYQQAETAVQFAQAEYTRLKHLVGEQLATRSQLDAAKKALSDAHAQQLQLKKQGLAHQLREIRAPFRAVITTLSVQRGQRLSAGMSLLQLANPAQLKVIIGMDAEDAAWINTGDPITLSPSLNPSQKVAAHITQRLYSINPQTRRSDLLVRLEGEQSKSFQTGMAVTADLSARSYADALSVPVQALMYDEAHGNYIMQVVQQHAILIPVNVALEQEGQAVIEGNIQASDQVVTTGVAELSDGDHIVVVPSL